MQDEPPKNLEEAIISDSDLVLYSRCPYAFYLQRLEGKTKIPTGGTAAQVLFFLEKRKKLFNVRDKKIGILFDNQRRAGKYLHHIEKMSREELAAYMPFKDAKSFGGSLKGKWATITQRNIFHNNPIYWNFAREHMKLGADLKKAGANYYQFIISNGAPVMGLIDKQRTVMFEGQHFKIKIPEIRVKHDSGFEIVIDNPSLYSFKGEATGKTTNANLQESAIITLSMYGFSKLLRKYPVTYLPKLNAPLEFWDFLENDDGIILQNLGFRHINLSKNTIDETARTDDDLDALRYLIADFTAGIAKERFEPNRKACHSCRYNILGIDGKPVCGSRNTNASLAVPSHYFLGDNFRIEENISGNNISLVGIVDRHDTVKIGGTFEDITASHQVGIYRINMAEFKDSMKASSHYNSDIYGTVYKKGESFETSMMSKLDEVLQRIADEKQKMIYHAVHFERDFNKAGKKRSRERLAQLGYAEANGGKFEKRYSPHNI